MTTRARFAPLPPRASDADLVVGVARGELGALGELYDRHQDSVRRVLERVTARSPDVDDLVQATFLELPRIASTFDGRDSARGWIVGIAVRLAARRRRSIARLLRALASFGDVSAERGVLRDPEAAASDREELLALDAALARLDARKREAFVLVEIEGLSIADAAVALAIREATVRTRLFYARAELRAALEGARG